MTAHPHLAWRLENGYSYAPPPQFTPGMLQGQLSLLYLYLVKTDTETYKMLETVYGKQSSYLAYVSSCGLKYSERDNRTSKMIQGVGNHHLLIQDCVLVATDCALVATDCVLVATDHVLVATDH